jgi:prophage regulatory protein
MQTDEYPDFVDARDLARMTGVKEPTWRYWAWAGQGPPSFKLGRRRVWRKSTVLAWIAAQEAAEFPAAKLRPED